MPPTIPPTKWAGTSDGSQANSPRKIIVPNGWISGRIVDIATGIAAAITAAAVGLFNDRGNYDASVNTFPASGGSGTAGAIKKGNIWTVSVAGTLGGSAVAIGDTVRALVDTPGQTAGNWAIAETNIGYVPENLANKNATGGYAGLTLFKINFKNALNTFTSFFTNSNTAARTYTFPDKDGTVAMTSDITAGITNAAGANVITKSDGTNLVASQIQDNGTTISFAGGVINVGTLPTSDPGVAGQLWNNLSVVTRSNG